MDARTAAGLPQLETITVNGRTFVAGLTWRPLRRARSYMSEARQIGKAEGMEMVAIRRAKVVTQAGFAPKMPGKFKGKYSLAAALAGEIGDNCIGVFQLGPDRFAFVAVHQAGIIPGRDFIADRARTLEVLQQTYGLLADDQNFKKTAKIIAPADFDYGGDEIPIDRLLARKKLPKNYQLRPLTFGLTPREIALGVGVVGALAAIVYGGDQWWTKHQASVAQREAAEAASQAQTAEEMAKATAAAGIVRPWTELPHIDVFVRACDSAVDSLPLSIGGWAFQSASCAPQGMTVSYLSDGTTTGAEFQAVAKASLGVAATYSQGDGGATGTFAVPLAVKPAADDALQGLDATQAAIGEYLRPVSDYATATFTEAPAVDPHVAADTPAPSWRTAQIAVKSAIPLTELLPGFTAGGLRFRQITTTLDPASAELAWTATGELYGR